LFGWLLLLSNVIDQIFKKILLVLFAVATVLTVFQVINRFLIGLPFPWGEELIRFLFVWVVFLGIGIVYKAKGHANVELLTAQLSEKSQRLLEFASELACLAFFFLLLFQGYNLFTVTMNQISPSMQINMGLVYLAVPVCALACLIHGIANLTSLFRNGDAGSAVEKREHIEIHP
jgi:TRAP-type C4-dicarboxylate transport system permease small subunit